MIDEIKKTRFDPFIKLARNPRLIQYLDGNLIMPINVEISPTGLCNAECPWCFYREKKEKDSLDTSKLLELIQEFSEIGVRAISWTGGGEPTMHPDFPKFIDKAYSLGIKQGIFTNAIKEIKYDPKKLEWIRVSNTNKPWNIKNLKKLRECKTLGMCMNYRGNDEEILNTLKIAKEIESDYLQVRPALELNGKKTNIKKPKIEDDLLILTDYKFNECNVYKTYTRCEGFHFVPFIWHNGDVNVCGYRPHQEDYNLGNINKEKFKKIMLKAPEYVKVLDDCQICCKNHEINKLIHNLRKLGDTDFV